MLVALKSVFRGLPQLLVCLAVVGSLNSLPAPGFGADPAETISSNAPAAHSLSAKANTVTATGNANTAGRDNHESENFETESFEGEQAPGLGNEKAVVKVDFARDVKPLLARRCFACHGPDKAEGGLKFTEEKTVRAEAESGLFAVVPFKPEESELLRRVTTHDEFERMPPEGKPLTAAEIETLRNWIAGGAKWDIHWAFKTPEVVMPPAVRNEQWCHNGIDRFLLTKLEAAGLQPASPADRRTLIRRVTFDVTGLPPTPAEIDAFVSDRDPLAYEKLVDRLLASPAYGERWARHWLDLVRYAETNSYERDNPKPNAWKYRDYVIDSLNSDKPYDQFLIEQLAGDELPDPTTDTLTATAYYRLGVWDDEPADPLQARYDEFDDIIKTTSQVMLGLTVDCARCHDHKIDPIPQKDYYSLLAFFHELTPYGTRGEQTAYNQIEITPEELRDEYERLRKRSRELRRRLHTIEQRGIVKMSAPDQRQTEGPDRERLLEEKLADYLSVKDLEVYTALNTELLRTEAEFAALPRRETTLGVAKVEKTPPETFVLLRGSPQAHGDPVEPAFPTIFDTAPPKEFPAGIESASSGRRLVLAEWIASDDNMLTSRVMANRLWQHHFGRGIVRSPNNFGQLGAPPTHPELLAWLGAELVRANWNLKPLHRLILTSAAYRMGNASEPTALAKDPANDLFWRFDMRRLSAEELRDSILAVTGQLNSKMHGEWFFPVLSEEVLAGQSRPGAGWGNSSESERDRRSIYIHVKRSLPVPLLAAFDFPETDVTCEGRFRTTQPAQALSLLNGQFLQEESKELAEHVKEHAGDDRSRQVSYLLEIALNRPATTREVERGITLMQTLQSKHNLSAQRAFELYCLVVLNLNEFVYLD